MVSKDSTLERDGFASRERLGLVNAGKIPPKPPTATVKNKHPRARKERGCRCASRDDGVGSRSDGGWNGTRKSGGFAAGKTLPQMDDEQAAALLEKLVLESTVMPLGRRPRSDVIAPSSLEGKRGGSGAEWAVGNDGAEEEVEEDAALAAAVAAALAWTPKEPVKGKMWGEYHQGQEGIPASRCDSGHEDMSDGDGNDSYDGNGTAYRSDSARSRYDDQDVVDTPPSQDGMTRGVGRGAVSSHGDTRKPRPGDDHVEYGLGSASSEKDGERCLSLRNCDDDTERRIAKTPQTSAPSPVDSVVDIGSAWPDKTAISMIAEIGGSCSSDITTVLTVGGDSEHSDTTDGQHGLSIPPKPTRLLVHRRSSNGSVTSKSTAASDTRRQHGGCEPKHLNAVANDPTDSALAAYDWGASDSDGASETSVKTPPKRHTLKVVDAAAAAAAADVERTRAGPTRLRRTDVSVSLCPCCGADRDSAQRRAITGWHQRASSAGLVADGLTAAAAVDADNGLGSDANGGYGRWRAGGGRLSWDALTQEQHMKHALKALDQQEPHEQDSDDESEENVHPFSEGVAIRVGVSTGAGASGVMRGGLGESVPRDMAAIPYSRLKGAGRRLPRRVHPARREEWLSAVEFLEAFGISYPSFRQLPFWRRVVLKQRAQLF
ncbi:unnamed protein product [Sphacelaria rigidula]